MKVVIKSGCSNIHAQCSQFLGSRRNNRVSGIPISKQYRDDTFFRREKVPRIELNETNFVLKKEISVVIN